MRSCSAWALGPNGLDAGKDGQHPKAAKERRSHHRGHLWTASQIPRRLRGCILIQGASSEGVS